MSSYQVRKEREFKIIGIIGIVFAVFNTWLNLSEFFTVGLLQKISGYPFGGEGPTPWYYQSAQVYAVYNLSIGLLFLAASILMFWGLYKSNRSIVFITFGVTLLLLVFQLSMGTMN
jgi:hypothetical protein